jgi:hypothetical protein
MLEKKYYFRAESIKDKHILRYGLLTYHNKELCIITEDNNKYFINENTIQQCTGLKDSNSDFVYVGDKIKHFEGKQFEVVFSNIKGILLSAINDNGEFANGSPYWIDDCEIIY